MSESTFGTEEKLTAEETAILEKAKRPVVIADRFRLFFLFASIVLVVIIYLGDKFGAGGNDKLLAWLYLILFLDIALMMAAIFIKIGCAVRYNRILKKL